MKKILSIVVALFIFSANAIAEDSFDYSNYQVDSSPESFLNAPSAEDLKKITDPHLRYCEEVFLKAYMRREFTEEENELCRDLFAMRIESELNFKKQALQNR